MRPVEQVSVLVRVGIGDRGHHTCIEVALDGQRALLPQGVARSLMSQLREHLVLAERIDERSLAGSFPLRQASPGPTQDARPGDIPPHQG